MNEIESKLRDWCASYVGAFNRADISDIVSHWAFPALLVSKGRNISFKNADIFAGSTSNLMSFYEARGVTLATRHLRQCLSLGEGVAAIQVRDEMLNSQGKVIVNWVAGYTLIRCGVQWRAIMANADGEISAWAALGTPLI